MMNRIRNQNAWTNGNGNKNFYTHIHQQYGAQQVRHLKEWQNTFKNLNKSKQQLKFLLRCRQTGVLPRHIHNLRIKKFSLKSKTAYKKLALCSERFQKALLNIEIEDANINIMYLNEKQNRLEKLINDTLPSDITDVFYASNHIIGNERHIIEKNRLVRKFHKLEDNENITNENEFLTKPTKNEFLTKPTNKNWMVNLTDKPIPENVKRILSLGKFCPPIINNKKIPVLEFIKEFETNTHKISNDMVSTLRLDFVKTIKDFVQNKKHKSRFDIKVNTMILETKQFLKENTNLLITRADKGQTTVVMKTETYIEKMNELLNDTSTYKKISKDPLNIMKNAVNDLIKRWNKCEYIDKKTYNHLRSPNDNHYLPKCYGLPKIHKTNNPLRIIVSSIDSPTYNLSRYMTTIIKEAVQKPTSYIKDSWSFVKKIKGINVSTDECLISLDVTSLFTNIPQGLVINAIEKRWHLINNKTAIPKNEFMIAINLLFNNTYFSFNGEFFSQIFGCPMGSPVSPIFADLVMDDLECTTLQKLSFSPKIFVRYVDDIFTIVPKNNISEMINEFNSYHPRLQFTYELQNDSTLNFLDTSIIKEENGSLKTNWYQKPTSSGRYINYFSNHPLNQKVSVTYGLVDRGILLSDPEFQETNIQKIKKILRNNNYPTNFIETYVSKRLKHINNTQPQIINERIDIERNLVLALPYVNILTEKLTHKLKHHHIKVVSKITNKTKFIKTGKDRLPKDLQSKLVYKIDCNICDKTYIGQTKRYLKKRLKEHRDNTNVAPTDVNAIKEHMITYSHDFDWNNIKILNKEDNHRKRLIAEMAHIKKHNKYTINRQQDTQEWNTIYNTLLTYI